MFLNILNISASNVLKMYICYFPFAQTSRKHKYAAIPFPKFAVLANFDLLFPFRELFTEC